MLVTPYKSYQPSKWEQRIDNAIGLLLPERFQRRVVAREQTNYFRYLSAQSNPGRRNAQAGDAGETVRKSREKLQMLWNAIEAFENSGLCGHLIRKMSNYICGTLRYQARTGDNTINNEYEDYMRLKCGRQIDYTKRFSLRKMCMLDVRGIGIKGDIGINIVREGPDLFLQGIEADRIGDPNQYEMSQNYIRGLVLNNVGQIVAARVYNRDRRNGRYTLDAQYEMWDEHGLPKFIFLVNPISFDDYRGVSILSAVMDLPGYVDQMRQYELQAMLWASSRSGVYYTKNAMLPKGLPFDANPAVDTSGNVIDTFQVRPNMVTALSADGEKVEMFHNERPSPNVIAMYKDTKAEVINGFGFTTNFIDPSGTGPAVRQCSAQDARAIEEWQGMLREDKLDWVAMMILGNAIANGELPFHPRWHMGQWFFPPKTSIDVGRDSKANIEELEAGINDGSSIAAENSQDIDEIKRQRGTEIEQDIQISQEIAKRRGIPDWKIVFAVMFPSAAKNMLPPPKVDAKGVTSDGVAIDGEPDAKAKQNLSLTIRHEVLNKYSADDGEWVTINGNHVHIGGDGTIDKGPKSLIGSKIDKVATEVSGPVGDYLERKDLDKVAEKNFIESVPDGSLKGAEFKAILDAKSKAGRPMEIARVLDDYTSEGYEEINACPECDNSKLLTTALRKMEPYKNGTLYRQMHFANTEEAMAFASKFEKKGAGVKLDRTVTSFTKDPTLAETFGRMGGTSSVQLEIAEYKSARDISTISANPDEGEVVFLHGARFQSLGVEKTVIPSRVRRGHKLPEKELFKIRVREL